MKKDLPSNPVELFFSITGEKYTALVVNALLDSAKTPDDLSKELSIAKADIIKCTQQLENTGIAGKILYPENPSSYKLSLTKTGMALKPIFDEIKKWSAAYN
jgi:DNA-binding HxlR family transcriptional regulator